MMIKLLAKSFSTKLVPQVSLAQYLNTSDDKKTCLELIDAFHTYGCVAVKDFRVSFDQNEAFLDMMEDYFASRGNYFYKTGQLLDCYQESGYNTGITAEFMEIPRSHKSLIASFTLENKPVSSVEPVPDPKWRYIFPVGPPRESRSKELDPLHTNPIDFPQFTEVMNKWGTQLLNCVNTVSEMCALGFGLTKDFFTDKLKGAHNILAPTESDLNKYGKGTVFAGFHYDFSFMTINEKCRFPGLYIWLNIGERIPVLIPDGFLLIQSSRTLEIATGGYIRKGMHEVVYDDRTEEKVQEYKAKGKKDIWRVSSTMFVQFASDEIVERFGKFVTPEAKKRYSSTTFHAIKEEELKATNLIDQSKFK